jgi:hypothetical protein
MIIDIKNLYIYQNFETKFIFEKNFNMCYNEIENMKQILLYSYITIP